MILSYDESKGYEHPDHIRIFEWGTEAFHAAGDPDAFPDKGPPWTPSKLYYFATFTKKRFQTLSDAAIAEGLESPYIGWLENWDSVGFEEPEITTQIDVTDYIEVRSKALLAHATQIDPESKFWFGLPPEVYGHVRDWPQQHVADTVRDERAVEIALEVEHRALEHGVGEKAAGAGAEQAGKRQHQHGPGPNCEGKRGHSTQAP